MLFFHLNRHTGKFIITTIIGCFIFPTTLLISGLLFVFRDSSTRINIRQNIGNLFDKFMIICVPIAFIILDLYVIYIVYTFDKNIYNSFMTTPTLYLASLVGCVIYFVLVIRLFFKSTQIFAILSGVKLKQIILFLIVALLIKLAHHFLSSDARAHLTTMDHLKLLLIAGLSHPFKWIVAHGVYFGVLISFLMIFYKELSESIYKMDTGISFLLLFFLAYSINSESRQLLSFLPFVTFWLVISLKDKSFSNVFLITIFVLSIFISRFWYPINLAFQNKNLSYSAIVEFPLQHYFMVQGPWIGHIAYFIQIIAFAVITLSIRAFYKKQSIHKEK